MKLQPAITFLFLLGLTLFYLGPGYYATAKSAIQCHCFTDRSYNPAKKFAADDYILATSFNSLLARLADLPKRQIVMIKMNEGVTQEDLLISLQIAKTTGQDIQKVLDSFRQKDNWSEIIKELSLNGAVNNDEVLEAIKTGTPTDMAGTRIADEFIAEFFRTPAEEIRKLRISGLNEKEITLVLLLNHVSEIQPGALVEQYKNKGRSWSEIAYNLGMEPKAAGKLILAYPAKIIPENN